MNAQPITPARAVPSVRPSRPNQLARLLAVIGWLVLGVLAFTAVLRLARLDGWVGGAVLSSIAPVSFLAAYPLFAGAVAVRRRPAAIAAAVGIGLHLWWFQDMLPLVHRGRSLPAGATAVRVMTANLLFDNGSAGKLAPTIRAEHPDLLALEEFTATTKGALVAAGALRGFPYHVERVTYQPNGIALYSRFPLLNSHVIVIGGRQVVVTQVRTTGGVLTVDVVHTVAPISIASHGQWHRELHGVANLVAGQRGQLLVAGDFNATDGNRAFRTLESRGHLVDVLDATGRGYAMTWPQFLPLPLVRPDHVLAGRGLVALRGHTLANPGSDHRAVVADVGVAPS